MPVEDNVYFSAMSDRFVVGLLNSMVESEILRREKTSCKRYQALRIAIHRRLVN